MASITWVAIAATAFVGTHFLLSHPLRAAIVARIGERGFLGVYSLVAFATLGWLVAAYRAAPAEAPFWSVGDGLWAIATVLMLLASILFMGSLIGNPALPDPNGAAKPAPTPRGVFTITRHPMMWAFAVWGVVHILVLPTPANTVLAAAIIVLALVGAHLQDIKKARLQPDLWPAWEARTSYWPFAARGRIGGFRGHDIGGGVVLWLAATWAHIPLAGWAAGVWRWIV
ncbi:MFS transporter [Sphingomonas sp. Leaf33]|uniref:NnrU family protein n=1 Tax=Sphingomonas sp. Leaf33 TaxID=1736215 RepID=UPI0006FC044F|nr:NnrU family protein [Sphingomonas sp. Leaf33]KQN25584.1 MFS transporter [Sphingomonas sp. Leaf33]